LQSYIKSYFFAGIGVAILDGSLESAELCQNVSSGNRKLKSKKANRKSPSLAPKLTPSQERAQRTFEVILEVAGELLKEVGVEKLTTILICDRAGITPPAVYRYFPNKYAILTELGWRLMEAEDAVVMDWLENTPDDTTGPFEQAVENRMELMRRVRQVGQDSPGGAWILRAMRAVPMLEEIRQQSIELVATAVTRKMVATYPDVDAERIATATRLTTSLSSLANELINDDPSKEAGITREMAVMSTLYYRNLLLGMNVTVPDPKK